MAEDVIRERFVLELEALPSDVAAAVRLRRLLKYALRACRLRCTRARAVPPDRENQKGQSS